MSSSQHSSTLSTASTPVSLPSIHEMFPDHLMRKGAHHSYDSEPQRSHGGYVHPESPGVFHPQHRHSISSQCGCRSGSHAKCPIPLHNPPTSGGAAQIHDPRLYEPQLGKERLSPSHNVYPFNVLRSSPASPSLQHIASSSTHPNRPANPQQLGHNSLVASGSSPVFRVSATPLSAQDDRHEGQKVRHGREAFPPDTSSPEGRYAVSSPRTRAQAGIDPYPAIISFPTSRPGPLPPAPSKHHHNYPNNRYPNNPPGLGSGPHEYEERYVSRDSFHSNGIINRHGEDANDEEDDAAASGADDNDTSNGKKHICPTCFKRFNRPSSLRIHVNTHTGATPFRCPWPNCGREFNVNSNMRRHYRNHTTPGFSRSQLSSNANNANPHPNDGRRKRRRVSAPQIPLPTSAASFTPGPPSRPDHAPYRTEYQQRHSPEPLHRPPHAPYPAHHAQTHRSVRPHTFTQQHSGSFMSSPPISSLSVSDDDSSSGSDSDMEEDKYPAPSSHMISKKEVDDDLIEYEPDASSLGYRTATLTQSLARVAVASINETRRSHPYGLYSATHQPAHGANNNNPPMRRPDHRYGHSSGHQDPRRPLTPGSSFHSSSASPSVSPSPPPSGNMEPNSPIRLVAPSSYKYSASTPYVRSLADSRVSTTLRPAFGNSSERERSW
ncbi:hypothetical protein GALMADRAFT_127348 [Galerina marginata CBS 339.88]|uniref:C2H2-type domain-containing protein n=1 Tax=Galerina marginata (strain CBS 339.88) TaxID=685588 RepID=A0A067SJQ9_GALM3|nr:hypothetical protein GALMADRAFT_127348 [Galerina marginata CBS 339.88]